MAKRMTLIESNKVSTWMLANNDAISTMTPGQLATVVLAATGVNINSAVAKRHRAQLGIVAVRVKAEKPQRSTKISALECRLADLEGRVAALEPGIM